MVECAGEAQAALWLVDPAKSSCPKRISRFSKRAAANLASNAARKSVMTIPSCARRLADTVTVDRERWAVGILDVTAR